MDEWVEDILKEAKKAESAIVEARNVDIASNTERLAEAYTEDQEELGKLREEVVGLRQANKALQAAIVKLETKGEPGR